MCDYQTIVVKFGGEITQSPPLLANLAASIEKIHAGKKNVILVHGGGPVATELGQKLSIAPIMVGGRRVTCEQTLEVMKMTLPGIVNSNVLAVLKKFKLPGVSVSGISIVDAITRPPKVVSGSDGKVIDFGYVGDILDINTTLLSHLLNKHFIPVISPLSCDVNGKILNINADTVASQTAKKIKAYKLVLITEIGGVFEDINDKSSRLKILTADSARQKIAEGIIQGGMIPKIEEGLKLLQGHLSSFHIVGINSSETLLQEINNPGSVGTAIVE